MKLETAYRKISKHYQNWEITILNVLAYTQPHFYIKAQRCSTQPLPDNIQAMYRHLATRGLANAMNAMALKLDRVEDAIDKQKLADDARGKI